MNKSTALILGFAVIAGAGCRRTSSWQQEIDKRNQQEQAWLTVANAFAAKHGAAIDWDARLPERSFFDLPFSIDLSRALIRSNEQPVLIVAYVDDVWERDGKCFARFSDLGDSDRSYKLVLELKCAGAQTKTLLGKEKAWLGAYAVVAKIENVARPTLGVKATGSSEESEVVLDNPPAIFSLKGTCVDLLPRPEPPD